MIMDAQNLEKLPPPPGVIASLQTGYNIVSSRAILLLFPALLDIFLWLGPRLSVGTWYGSLLDDWIDLLKQNNFPARELSVYTENAPILIDFFQRLNWLSWFRTLPIGIPLLMLDLPQDLPVTTPLGTQTVIQLSSFLSVAGSLAVLTLAGWLGGGWYFRLVAGASLSEDEAGIGLFRALGQTILLSIIWGIGSIVLILPIVFLVGLLSALNEMFAQISLLIVLFFLFWLIVPLFFTPHGIFVRRQNAFGSIMSSLRMSRFTLPTSSMFVLCVFLLSRGLDYLWLVPPKNSWLTVVGIAGHSFISTTLLSASFIYYRDMTNWLQNVYARFQQMSNSSSMKKI
jgi:hypothetical protein